MIISRCNAAATGLVFICLWNHHFCSTRLPRINIGVVGDDKGQASPFSDVLADLLEVKVTWIPHLKDNPPLFFQTFSRFQGNPETKLDVAVVDLSVYSKPFFRHLLLDLDTCVLVYKLPLPTSRCSDVSSPVLSTASPPPPSYTLSDTPDRPSLESSDTTEWESPDHLVSMSPNLTIQSLRDITSDIPPDSTTLEPRDIPGPDLPVFSTPELPDVSTTMENPDTTTNETAHISSPVIFEPVIPVLPYLNTTQSPDLTTPKPPDLANAEMSSLPNKHCLTPEIPKLPNRWEVLASVIPAKDVPRVIILFDNETEDEATQLSNHQATKGTLMRTINVESDVNMTSVYEYVATQLTSQSLFLVLCSAAYSRQILTSASQFDGPNMRNFALSRQSLWLIVLPPDNQTMLEEIDLTLDNVAVVIYSPSAPGQQVPIEQGLRLATTQIFKAVKETLSSTTNKSLEATFVDLLFETLAWRSTCWRNDVYTLMWEGGARRLRPVGYVNQTGCLNLRFALFPNADFGFNGRNLLVATLPWEPFVIRSSTENGTHNYTGFCIDILEKMALVLNFTYALVEPADRQRGIRVNDTWTGLVGVMQRREADFTMAPLMTEPDRETVMDFTFPFSYDSVVIVFKRPDPAALKWRTFIQPFRTEVHLLLCLCLGLMSVLLSCTESFNPFYQKWRPRFAMDAQIVKGEAFWCLFGPMVMQGGEKLPQSQAGRVLVSCWCLFVVVITATYSGNLVAFLTVTKGVLPFDSLAGMLEHSQYAYGVTRDTFYHKWLETSSANPYRGVWEKIEAFERQGLDVLSVDQDVQMRRVLQGNYGFIVDKHGIDNWLARECDLRVLPETLHPLQYGIGLPNNSPHLDLFSNKMLWMHESGLIEAMKRRWWTNQKFCKGDLVSEAAAITVVDVQSAFYLLIIGLVAAGFVLIAEHLCRRWRQRRRNVLLGSEVVHSADSAMRDGDLSARGFPLLQLPHSAQPFRQIPFRQQFGLNSSTDVALASPARLDVTSSGQSDIFIY